MRDRRKRKNKRRKKRGGKRRNTWKRIMKNENAHTLHNTNL